MCFPITATSPDGIGCDERAIGTIVSKGTPRLDKVWRVGGRAVGAAGVAVGVRPGGRGTAATGSDPGNPAYDELVGWRGGRRDHELRVRPLTLNDTMISDFAVNSGAGGRGGNGCAGGNASNGFGGSSAGLPIPTDGPVHDSVPGNGGDAAGAIVNLGGRLLRRITAASTTPQPAGRSARRATVASVASYRAAPSCR